MIYPWQTTQWHTFCQQKIQQRLAHAIVITGVEGLGKLAFANQMVASVLCEHEDREEACGQCHSCQLFTAGSHPDHILIEPEEAGKQIKIDQIRQLKDKQELTPTVAKWKTVIISPADSMNINANNSLLKLLEEPQENTLLILVSSKAYRFPITILSRCQKLALTAPEMAVSVQWCQQQAKVDKSTIEQVLPLAKGAPLKALELLEADSLSIINQIDADFKSLLQGSASPVHLAKEWQKYDLSMVFNYLQLLIKKQIISNESTLNEARSKYYWTIYDCIIATIKLISSSNNINKILLIEQFMVSVMNRDLNYNTAINS